MSNPKSDRFPASVEIDSVTYMPISEMPNKCTATVKATVILVSPPESPVGNPKAKVSGNGITEEKEMTSDPDDGTNKWITTFNGPFDAGITYTFEVEQKYIDMTELSKSDSKASEAC